MRLSAGIAGGLLGAFAMDMFVVVASASGRRREVDGAAPGTDRLGRGMQPPQAAGDAADDAAVRAGTAAFEAMTSRTPDPETRRWLGTLAHYGFGATAGACYGLLADRVPALRACFGTLYGSLVWAVADEGIMPALGLSRGPRELPAALHAYSLVGHFAYGAALESVVRGRVTVKGKGKW